MSLDEIPMFVKANTLLPLARPVNFVTPSTVFEINCKVYGNPEKPIQLFEDNSFNFDFEKGKFNWVKISFSGNKINAGRSGNYSGKLYDISNSFEKF
jgi:alpha-D-xyloside xylohydrolase